MDYNALAQRLLPGEYPALESFEKRYPPRDLPKNAEVTPAYIPQLAEKIAGWRGENLPDFAARVYQNSLEFIHVG